MDYVVTGLNMVDVLKYADGSKSNPQIGGTPLYGYCGMRPYTKSILFAARVGNDFFDIFNPWFERNRVDVSGLKFVSDQTPSALMEFDETENYSMGPFFTGDWNDSDFWRPKPEDFAGKLKGTKGFYITSGPPPEEIWNGLFDLKEQFGFKVMWEPNGAHTFSEDKDSTIELCKKIEMVSFNLPEGKRIFCVDTEEELIEFLKNLGPELVLLRLGARGLYSIHNKKAWFIPSVPRTGDVEVVDVTGCGNASTAGGCFAWCEGNDPIMTGIIANVAAYYNLQQQGPYPLFSDKMMAEAKALADKLYNEYDKEAMRFK